MMVSWSTFALLAATTAAPQATLLDFYSDYCPPCKQMMPVVQRLEAAGYPVQKINVSQQPQVAQQYGVRGVPCFVMVAGGREVDRVKGLTSLARLQQMYQRAGFRPQTQQQPQPQQQPQHAFAKGAPAPASQVRGQSPDTSLAPQGFKPAQRSAPAGPPTRLKSVELARDFARAAAPTGPRHSTESAVRKALAASVRIKIADASGHSYGSGTIIDCHGEEALVLTCAHIFRDSQGKGRIKVDLFDGGRHRTVPGNLISYDLKRDVGLVSIRPGRSIKPVAVGGVAVRPQRGERVFSIGCDRGADPSVRQSRVTAVNKYLGAANIEAAGAPVDGRSGGGLFRADGTLVGVCNAADPQDDEGLYAALPTVHAQLDDAKLSFVYDRRPVSDSERSFEHQEAVAATAPGANDRFPVPATQPAKGLHPPLTPLNTGQQKLLAALRDRTDDAEVICIVRSRSNPRQENEVIVVSEPTDRFLNLLAEQGGSPDGTRDTSLHISRQANQAPFQRPQNQTILRGQR